MNTLWTITCTLTTLRWLNRRQFLAFPAPWWNFKVALKQLKNGANRDDLNPAKTFRTDLVRVKCQSEEDDPSWLELVHRSSADVIKPVSVVRDLGVFLDSELFMRHHINTVVRSCFFSSLASKIGSTHPRWLPQALCQPSWQPGLTTVTQSSQAFYNLRLIHFNVFKMRRPDLLLEQERSTASLQSSRAYTGFRLLGSALPTSSACSCTWCELVAALCTCRT